MRRYLYVLLILIAVPFVTASSCSTSVQDFQPASSLPGLNLEQRAFALNEEFGVLVKIARDYADQPVCTDLVVVACSEPEVIDLLAEAAQEGRTVVDALIAIARTGTTEGSVGGQDALDAARTGLRELSNILARRATS